MLRPTRPTRPKSGVLTPVLRSPCRVLPLWQTGVRPAVARPEPPLRGSPTCTFSFWPSDVAVPGVTPTTSSSQHPSLLPMLGISCLWQHWTTHEACFSSGVGSLAPCLALGDAETDSGQGDACPRASGGDEPPRLHGAPSGRGVLWGGRNGIAGKEGVAASFDGDTR